MAVQVLQQAASATVRVLGHYRYSAALSATVRAITCSHREARRRAQGACAPCALSGGTEPVTCCKQWRTTTELQRQPFTCCSWTQQKAWAMADGRVGWHMHRALLRHASQSVCCRLLTGCAWQAWHGVWLPRHHGRTLRARTAQAIRTALAWGGARTRAVRQDHPIPSVGASRCACLVMAL